MKTSLIINPQAFRAELYKCFFWYRSFFVNGRKFVTVPSYIDSDFIVSFFDVTEVENQNEGTPEWMVESRYENLPLLDSVYNHKWSANEYVGYRSTSPEDYYKMFFIESRIMMKEMRKFIKNENATERKSEQADTWLSGDVLPEDTEEGCSKDVLIDMNGKRKDFQVGWYDHDEKEWRFHVSDTSNLVLEKLEWKNI